jgi:hypothetical protein
MKGVKVDMKCFRQKVGITLSQNLQPLPKLTQPPTIQNADLAHKRGYPLLQTTEFNANHTTHFLKGDSVYATFHNRKANDVWRCVVLDVERQLFCALWFCHYLFASRLPMLTPVAFCLLPLPTLFLNDMYHHELL